MTTSGDSVDGVVDSFLPSNLNDGIPLWHAIFEDKIHFNITFEALSIYQDNFLRLPSPLDSLKKNRVLSNSNLFSFDKKDYNNVVRQDENTMIKCFHHPSGLFLHCFESIPDIVSNLGISSLKLNGLSLSNSIILGPLSFRMMKREEFVNVVDNSVLVSLLAEFGSSLDSYGSLSTGPVYCYSMERDFLFKFESIMFVSAIFGFSIAKIVDSIKNHVPVDGVLLSHESLSTSTGVGVPFDVLIAMRNSGSFRVTLPKNDGFQGLSSCSSTSADVVPFNTKKINIEFCQKHADISVMLVSLAYDVIMKSIFYFQSRNFYCYLENLASHILRTNATLRDVGDILQKGLQILLEDGDIELAYDRNSHLHYKLSPTKFNEMKCLLKSCDSEEYYGYKGVDCFSLDNRFLCNFENIEEASRKLEIEREKILRVCLCERKSARGLKFQFSDDNIKFKPLTMVPIDAIKLMRTSTIPNPRMCRFYEEYTLSGGKQVDNGEGDEPTKEEIEVNETVEPSSDKNVNSSIVDSDAIVLTTSEKVPNIGPDHQILIPDLEISYSQEQTFDRIFEADVEEALWHGGVGQSHDIDGFLEQVKPLQYIRGRIFQSKNASYLCVLNSSFCDDRDYSLSPESASIVAYRCNDDAVLTISLADLLVLDEDIVLDTWKANNFDSTATLGELKTREVNIVNHQWTYDEVSAFVEAKRLHKENILRIYFRTCIKNTRTIKELCDFFHLFSPWNLTLDCYCKRLLQLYSVSNYLRGYESNSYISNSAFSTYLKSTRTTSVCPKVNFVEEELQPDVAYDSVANDTFDNDWYSYFEEKKKFSVFETNYKSEAEIVDVDAPFVNNTDIEKEEKEANESVLNRATEGSACFARIRKFFHGKKPVEQIDVVSNSVLRRYYSLTEASNLMKASISSLSLCCNNRIPSSYGFRWRFLDFEACVMQSISENRDVEDISKDLMEESTFVPIAELLKTRFGSRNNSTSLVHVSSQINLSEHDIDSMLIEDVISEDCESIASKQDNESVFSVITSDDQNSCHSPEIDNMLESAVDWNQKSSGRDKLDAGEKQVRKRAFDVIVDSPIAKPLSECSGLAGTFESLGSRSSNYRELQGLKETKKLKRADYIDPILHSSIVHIFENCQYEWLSFKEIWEIFKTVSFVGNASDTASNLSSMANVSESKDALLKALLAMNQEGDVMRYFDSFRLKQSPLKRFEISNDMIVMEAIDHLNHADGATIENITGYITQNYPFISGIDIIYALNALLNSQRVSTNVASETYKLTRSGSEILTKRHANYALRVFDEISKLIDMHSTIVQYLYWYHDVEGVSIKDIKRFILHRDAVMKPFTNWLIPLMKHIIQFHPDVRSCGNDHYVLTETANARLQENPPNRIVAGLGSPNRPYASKKSITATVSNPPLCTTKASVLKEEIIKITSNYSDEKGISVKMLRQHLSTHEQFKNIAEIEIFNDLQAGLVTGLFEKRPYNKYALSSQARKDRTIRNEVNACLHDLVLKISNNL